ncbi:ABC transporter permease [Nitrospirillum viridazoti]|uniref:Transport permease protein n=1 Tax=Nitrospirillum viridazoti CBAmc TaxID=1441467 RepID=A0A248K2P7_9PROT|nr:ABC transporter permease [Nitrospirillum amazonense]ASG24694.1 sugar ABC transporter permease [Nitrospirillum amazonense CBAmc]TWB36930.1 lipopolysaccharide transport system permease protein [Nitrospirillum amazonense]
MSTAAVMSPSITSRLYANRRLILRLAVRQLSAKWQGTMLGMVWSLLTPLLTFAVYGFVFTQIFHSRWTGSLSAASYPLLIFSGLVTFSIFSETVNAAPTLILENASYVKKVIFPLEILPIVSILVNIVNAGFGLAILLIVQLVTTGSLSFGLIYVPFIILPLGVATLGVAWFLASLGVFIRDMRHIVGVATSLLMFLTPIFYAPETVPDSFKLVMKLNPIALTLEQMRAAIFLGQFPDLLDYLGLWAYALFIASLGYAWFARSRKAFADVL